MNRNSTFYRYPILIEPAGNQLPLAQRVGGSETAAVVDAIKPLLDGTHAVADIYAKLSIAGFEVQAIARALEHLDKLGAVGEAPAVDEGALTEDEVRRYSRQIGLFDDWLDEDPVVAGPQTKGHQVQVNLRSARVILVGLDRTGSKLARTLAAAGVGEICGIGTGTAGVGSSDPEAMGTLAEAIGSINPSVRFSEVQQPQDLPPLDNGAVSLLIYCPDEFDQPLCIQLNELALGTSTPFLIYRQTVSHVEIGPLIFPRETACYICCDLRRKGALNGMSLDELCPKPSCGFSFSIGVDFLALEVIKILTRVALPVCRGKIWRLNLKTGLSDVHPVLKLPRCVACGVHRKTPFRKLWET